MALEDDETIKASHSSSSSKSIPTEIIFEILSRLPVKSLLRYKSVCKSWRSLISDPYFIKYHLALSTTNRHYVHHHFLLCTCALVENLKTCPLYDVLYDHNPINPLQLDYPMKDFSETVSIIGSCNGLICIAIDRNNLFIWNPSTRKSIQLPDCPSFGVLLLGFGYDESSDDYKVVEVAYPIDEGDPNVVMIYSSKNGNWKEIGGFPCWFWLQASNVFVNGAFHWIVTQDYHHSLSIVSLDLANETYGRVLLPPDDEANIDLTLGILGDCLCVISDYSTHRGFCVDVWVMKVYGVKDSWFKLVSIPVTVFEPFIWGDQMAAPPLCVSEDGKVLLQFESRLIVFDSKDGSALEIQKFDNCYKACTIVESLVSPADDGKVLVEIGWRLIVFDSKDNSALEIQKFNECNDACTYVESLVSPAGHENLI